jgi:Uncharacterized vancomycin resistance protein
LVNAYSIGRKGNFFDRFYNSISVAMKGTDLKLQTRFNKNKLTGLLKTIKKEIDTKAKDASISFNKGKTIINKDVTGKYLNVEENINLIEDKLSKRVFSNFTLNVEKIEPKLSYSDIKEVKSVVSQFSTTFSLNDTNRGDNIRLACKRINGKILMPGEVFSMNEILGPRTLENGYKEAPVIIKNELTPGTGGGICQVTTTLYNAVLKAKLSVLERSHHSMPLAYVKPGQDATISEGSLDFKFKNSNNYPICLNTEVIGGKIIMRIFGKKSSTNNIVKLYPDVIETVAPGEDEIEIDNSLADEEKIVVRKPKNGIRVILYRDTYSENNVFLEREKISEDYYKPIRGLIKINSNYLQ